MRSFSFILLAIALARAAPLLQNCVEWTAEADGSVVCAQRAGSVTLNADPAGFLPVSKRAVAVPRSTRGIWARQDDDFGDFGGGDDGDDDGGDDFSGDGGDDGSGGDGDDSADDDTGDDGSQDVDDGQDDSAGDDGGDNSVDDGSADGDDGDDSADGTDDSTDGGADAAAPDDGSADASDSTDTSGDGSADSTDGSTDSTDSSDNTDSTDSSDASATPTTDDSDAAATPSASTDDSDAAAASTTPDATTDDSDAAAASTIPDATSDSDAAASSSAPDATSSADAAQATPPPTAASQQNNNCAASATAPNAATINVIKQFEGFVPSPKPDPIGLPTVGFGHKCVQSGCTEVPFSFPLSQTTATQLLAQDSTKFVNCLQGFIGKNVVLNDNQFGALTAFAFNLGCGTVQKSTLLKRLNGGEDPNTVASQEIPKFNKAGGKVLAGLTRRRAAEVALFQTPSDVIAHPLCA